MVKFMMARPSKWRAEIAMAAFFAAHSVIDNRRRVLLALVGVAIGIAAITALLLVGRSMEGELRRSLESLGSDVLTLQITIPELVGGEGKMQSQAGAGIPNIFPDDVQAVVSVLEKIPGVAAVGTIYSVPGCTGGAQSGDFSQVYLADDKVVQILRLSVAEGRMVGALDRHQLNTTIAADVLGATGKPVAMDSESEAVELCGRFFRVIGKLHRARAAEVMPALRLNHAFFIPPSHWATQALTGTAPTFLIKVGAHAPGDLDGVLRDRLTKLFPWTFVVSGAKQIEQMRKEQISIYNNFFLLIGSVSLLVGSLGIANLMYTSVSERYAEIGLRIAIGARRQSIILQFLMESILVCLLGAVVGVVLGMALGAVAVSLLGEKIEWSLVDMVVAATVALLCGCGAGIFPARKAANVDPVVSLQGIQQS